MNSRALIQLSLDLVETTIDYCPSFSCHCPDSSSKSANEGHIGPTESASDRIANEKHFLNVTAAFEHKIQKTPALNAAF